MKIIMILASYLPPDPRVEKEAISLNEAGHEVHVLCYAKENQPDLEHTKNYTIHRFSPGKFFIKKLNAIALVAPFFFMGWQKQIRKLQKKYQFDVIHIHDLPLSKPGFWFKTKYGGKLVCDQHEFYSDWIKKTAHMNTVAGKVISRMSDWEKYEEKYLTLADLVITVAEPLRKNYLNKYKLDPQKIITVPNTPTNRIFNFENQDLSIIEEYRNQFILFYAGGIDILRGIDTAIKALVTLKDKIPNLKLVLGGRIIKPYDPFKTAKKYNVENFMEFKGWIDEKDLPSYITASKICFFTPPANRDEINKTIATKIYQYAIMKRPMIVSDAIMMKDFVEKNKLGFAIKTDDSKAFANSVLMIFNNKFKLPGYEIGDSLFWENTVDILIEKYQELS